MLKWTRRELRNLTRNQLGTVAIFKGIDVPVSTSNTKIIDGIMIAQAASAPAPVEFWSTLR